MKASAPLLVSQQPSIGSDVRQNTLRSLTCLRVSSQTSVYMPFLLATQAACRSLSSGMQQRVGLARALTNDAPVLLMDEAYSALDPLIRTDMQTMLLDLQKEIKKTVLFITHDLDEALRLGDQIAILRDGEVIQQGTSQDIVLRPADDYVANFVKEVNRGRFVHVEAVMTPISEHPIRGGGVRVPAGTSIDEAARILFERPEGEVALIMANGRPVGTVTLRQVTEALVKPLDKDRHAA